MQASARTSKKCSTSLCLFTRVAEKGREKDLFIDTGLSSDSLLFCDPRHMEYAGRCVRLYDSRSSYVLGQCRDALISIPRPVFLPESPD